MELVAYALIAFFVQMQVGIPLGIGVMFSAVFSKLGLAIVLFAAAVGFVAGAARMAAIFSFFWGTHSVWNRVRARFAVDTESRVFRKWLLGFLGLALVITLLYVNLKK